MLHRFYHWVKSQSGLARPGKQAVPPIHTYVAANQPTAQDAVQDAGEGSAINGGIPSGLPCKNLNLQPD